MASSARCPICDHPVTEEEARGAGFFHLFTELTQLAPIPPQQQRPPQQRQAYQQSHRQQQGLPTGSPLPWIKREASTVGTSGILVFGPLTVEQQAELDRVKHERRETEIQLHRAYAHGEVSAHNTHG
ncbi:hypothetical protein K431DRAFT_307293 [Polychaeton citri CBS 116435]|uniref:Uncharacterized protein n=1 Tax=Polychaeton citri CBS 116435 TaxID=1314669 RepID=A0A9P4Q049_9PEZI|nr:hypothetical protein K431DRAFT_307293 [Polychaeton citri CBS 116435]